MKAKFLFKKSCVIGKNVKFGKNVIVYPNNVILGKTKIGDGCILYPNNFINSCEISHKVEIKYSYLENSVVGESSTIGPFANLRSKNIVGCNCKIGDFVELKNCSMGNNTKASHHSYLGDVEIGERCNVGAGVIVANFDGEKKHKSYVGDDVFLGCNSNLISPIFVADGTFVCAGTTLTQDTNKNDFVIGRARECVKPNRTMRKK